MPKTTNTHGGKRAGAGRPKGSRMRRSDAMAERLIAAGRCPVDALVRLAERAEAEGEISQAIGAWRSILPYIYPKPKAVEVAPEVVIDLARDLDALRTDVRQSQSGRDFVNTVDWMVKKLEAEKEEEERQAKTAAT